MREGTSLRPGRTILLGLVLVAASVDLATKVLADTYLPGMTVQLLPFLSFDLHHNRGISFSMFQAESGAGLAFLLLLQGAGTAAMAWWMLTARGVLERVSFALIAGGALGNLLDRLSDGAVTDFLDLHPIGWRLFTFNFADMFISAGVALLVTNAFRQAAPAERSAMAEDVSR
jgi:signal peptidase II